MKVGFTAGNFDLLHPGYIYTFEEAKRHCDKFIVFLQKDPSESRYSKYKPVISYYERYKTLMSIKYVDEVYTYCTEEELYELIKFFKPDIRILGEDYIGKDSSAYQWGAINTFWSMIIIIFFPFQIFNRFFK